MSNVSNGTDRASAVGSSSPVLFIKGSEPDSLKLFVRNLPTEDVTADEVAKAFASYGTVVKVKVRLINGQQPTGNAEVEIEDPVSAFKNDMVNGKRRYVSFRNTKVLCHLDNIRMDSLRQSAKLVRPALNEDEITMDRIALGAFVEQDVFYEQWECTHDVKLSVDYFNYQEMKVEFSRRGHLFKLVYRFKNVRDFLRIDRRVSGSTCTYHIAVSLSLPPKAFHEQSEALFYTKRPRWDRLAASHIAGKQLPADVFFANGMVDQRRYVADMPDSGRFMDHHYTVSFERHKDQNTLEERKFLSVLSKLSEYGLVVNLDCYMDIRFVPQVEVPKPYDVHAAPLPFNVKFKLLGLLSYNIVSEFNVDDEFIQILVDASPAIAEGALEQMMKPKLHLWKPKDSLRKQLENTAAIRNKIITNDKLNYNQRLIRKIVITPTKIYYQGPQLELINRVLRIHRDEHDNFMRVTFAEDDLQRLSSARGTELLFNRIEAIFHAGVNVAGQWFNFLHYSNSSMKNSGCWFVSPFDKGFTSTTAMLDTLGDFSTITNPATLGARIAQCFSSTTVTGKLSEDNVREIADIERNGFVFSDGVGLLGRNIAKNQFANLQKHQRIRPRCPAALQFRLGGSKGVLVLSNTIPKNEVHIRKSQMKYIRYHMKPCFLALQICRTSFYSPGYLNHQYIILLETLGIRKEVFLELRDECIKQLDQAMQEPTEAMRVLAENQDELGISHTLMQLVKAGFFDAREPFLINQLKLFRALQLRDLKRRAKIHVKKSCTLLGVMDETGALLEGKLYVQYTDPLTLQTRVHEGPVIVCRSPCLHPGDVQIAECVDIKELKHLEDVVVFSQHGERPLPNMLAGGDLDGDTFFVCWDERLIPKVTDQPMKYVTGATAFRDEGATAMVKNTGRHFINFLKNDNLGRIDNAWKAWADISSQGARNRNAIKLAELHSDAVDFAKKGVPAIMPSDLTPSEWPDFMEKPRNYRTYESTKAIGHIYRSVSTGLELVKDFKPLPELIVEGYEEYLHDARLTKEAYDRQISALMNQYDIGSEFELVSGYMFKLDDLNIKKRPMELKEQVMQSVHIINTQFRELFWTTHIFEEPAIESFRKRNTTVALTTPLHDQIKRKASAWYMAAYDLSPSQPAPRSTEEQQAVRRRTDHLEGQDREYYLIDWDMSGRFYSFPWIMYDVLCNIFYLSKHGSLESTGPGGVQRPVRFGSTEGQVPKLGLVGSNDFTTTVLRPAGKEEFFAQVGVSSRGSQSTN